MRFLSLPSITLCSTLFLLGALKTTSALSADNINKVAFQLPPAAELQYSIKAKQSGISLGGSANVKWLPANHTYQILTETHANLFGKILDASSIGGIDEFGLAPEKSIEKRLGKQATTTTFDRDSKTIRFTESQESYVIKGGEQDRTSATWQLVAQARAAGDNLGQVPSGRCLSRVAVMRSHGVSKSSLTKKSPQQWANKMPFISAKPPHQTRKAKHLISGSRRILNGTRSD